MPTSPVPPELSGYVDVVVANPPLHPLGAPPAIPKSPPTTRPSLWSGPMVSMRWRDPEEPPRVRVGPVACWLRPSSRTSQEYIAF